MIASVFRDHFTRFIAFMIEFLYILVNSTFSTLLREHQWGQIRIDDNIRPIETIIHLDG
jgi:hypothetical protein